MQTFIHQTHHTIADFDNIYNYIEKVLLQKSNGYELHIFPELFLTGYPLQDLCLQKEFIDKYIELKAKINKLSLSLEKNSNKLLLVGGLEYKLDTLGLPLSIENSILKIFPSTSLEKVYTKQLLPNYDIFDEEKYFRKGKESSYIKFANQNIGLLICEDMWVSSHHQNDPVKSLKDLISKDDISLDLVVNLSASPFHLGKEEKRNLRASEISHYFRAPFAYVNRVGGEDEILFDGSSFIMAGDNIIKEARPYTSDIISFSTPLNEQIYDTKSHQIDKVDNTWESLFTPQFAKGSTPPRLQTWSDEECDIILRSLGFGIQEYAKKCGMKNFLIALSGGMDSALVLTIVKLFLKDNQKLEAIYMPGFFSAGLSYDLSYELCKNLGIPLVTQPIKFMHSTIKNNYKESFGVELDGLADENIQSRLRGSLLYARSNHTGAMVLNTSNKSEIAVGYSTLYGDSVGAISVLGDLYKSEVFRLARYINDKFDNIIPEEVITRPPSAELREDQEDSQSLPPYEILDPILDGFLSNSYSINDLIKSGFDKKDVDKAYKLYTRSEYKRNQFCPIIKVKAKSFGFGYRQPICKKNSI